MSSPGVAIPAMTIMSTFEEDLLSQQENDVLKAQREFLMNSDLLKQRR